MKGLTAVVFAAMLSLGNAQTPAATPSPLPTTATLANPAVVYITKFVGTWCTGAVSMVTAYPLGVCITTVNSAGIAVGGMKLSTLPSPGNMVIQYTTFKSSTCGDSGGATQQWLTTSSMPSITSAQVLAGASPIPAVDQCTDNTYASAGASFRTTLGTVAPSAANPNPLGFPAMRISSYVPASASGSTCAQNYATPVVVYESVMNTCQSTGAVTLVSPITVASSIASAPSPSPPSSVPTLPPTVPVETVMGLQSLTSVCVNGIVSEQYFSNPTCSYDVQEQLLGYAATQGPSICVNGNADMQMPGAARYPMLFQGIALNYQMYAGPYKLVTCSSGDPVPPNANQAGDGWIYTAGYSSGDCSGSPQAMFQGKPTSVCIFDPATNGGVIYKCAPDGADGYSAFFFSDPGCTKPATYTPNGEAPFPGGCQTNPSLFSPKMQWIKTPNFNSQQNLCQAGSARPLGLGVSMVQYESAGCAGRSIGFVSLAFGSHNTSGQVTLPSGTQTSNPQTFSTLSCSGPYCALHPPPIPLLVSLLSPLSSLLSPLSSLLSPLSSLSFSPSPHPDSPSIQHTNQQRDVC